MTRNPVEDARRLWALEISDFLHYVVEVATPVVVREYDHEILAAFKDCYQREQELAERIVDLLIELDSYPERPPYDLDLGHYNFLRPEVLCEEFVKTCERDLVVLRALRAAYEDCEDLKERLVRHLLDDFIALREEFIARAQKLIKGSEKARAIEEAEAAGREVEIEEEEEEGAASEGEEFPWHDDSLSLDERMELAKNGGLFEKLFAAMAQTDCTACGYDCEGYARAIAEGEETDLSKCAPGEQETQEMLEKLVKGK